MSLSCSINSHANDLTQTSDYCSMPNNFDDFDKSVGGRSSRGAGSNVFLQNSIWSNNSQNSAADTDESFYYKVWNSNKKLDAMHGMKLGNYGPMEQQLQQKHPEDAAASYVLPPYHASSKWSEGINAGPHNLPQKQHPQQQQHFLQPQNQLRLLIDNTNNHLHHHHASSLCTTTDYTDSSTTVSLSSSWQTPVAYNSASNPMLLQCNNLQPDLQSWSASNPMSLTEMYESSIDTVDTNNLKMLLSAGSESTSTLNAGAAINLPNHSTFGSGFVEYSRVKTMLRPRSHELFMQRQQYIAQLMLRPRERFPENENLLTSQRTHFNPINSFIDGHSFEISSSLDVIEYARSPSGGRYLDADKYVEYTRNDSLLGEDDITEGGADMSATASNTPLYATSNCAAATARKAAVKENFIIRFAMRNCEIACQTEDNIEEQTRLNVLTFEQQFACQQLAKSELMARRHHQQQHYPMYMVFANQMSMPMQQNMNMGNLGNLMQHTSNTLACNDAIQALNKAVAAAATAASLGNANVWVPNATMGCDMDNYRASQLLMRGATSSGGGQGDRDQGQGIWQRNRSQHLMDAAANNQELDELDCNRQQQQQEQWSMHEIGKQCMLKGHHHQQQQVVGGNDAIIADSDNNNCLDDERHSMWSMCAACNNEYKSVPANSMLRDELQLEADEIMSDLKYMQDLYIGQRAASSLDAHSDATTQCADDLMECNNKNTVGNVSDWRLLGGGGGYGYDDEPMHVPVAEHVLNAAEDDSTHTVIEKVNRLIVDLLCPQTEAQQQQATPNDEEGALWYSGSNNKNNVSSTNIWQELEHKDVLIKPIDLIRHFTNEPLKNNVDAEHRQLEWEHSNLADIWRKTPLNNEEPANSQIQPQQEQQQQQNLAALDESGREEKFPIVEALLADADEQRDDTAALSFQPPNVSATALKRIHQFLNANAGNTSAAKLKLANRKRRHSASQNYFNHTMAMNMAGLHCEKNNNNNSIDVADLNSFNLKLKNLAKAFEINQNKGKNNEQCRRRQTTEEEKAKVGEEDILMEHQQQHEHEHDHEASLPNQQTYITCKYWTTLEPTTNLLDLTTTTAARTTTTTLIGNDQLINDTTNDVIGTGIDTIDGNTFSCLIDKNARILKHVTMLTRPLTR